jgi:Sensors of blue-light using FAD
MFHVVYSSTASHLFSKSELRPMLGETRLTAARFGVTGMLLYKDGAMLQVLEGDDQALMRRVSLLYLEPRHKDLHMLMRGITEERLFLDWSMAFRDLTDKSLLDTRGFSDFLNTPYTGEEFSGHPAKCFRLLLLFKKNM